MPGPDILDHQQWVGPDLSAAPPFVFAMNGVEGAEGTFRFDVHNRAAGMLATSTGPAADAVRDKIDWNGECERASAPWQKLACDGDVATPAAEKVRSAFTEEKIRAIATLRKPCLVLVPQMEDGEDFPEMVRRIDRSGFAAICNGTYVNERVFGKVDQNMVGHKKIVGWKPVWIEGAVDPGITHGDDQNKKLSVRCACVQGSRFEGVGGTHRCSYAALMIKSMFEGNPIDHPFTVCLTVFDADEACSDNLIPSGFFSEDQVDFIVIHLDDALVSARFRSTVEEDVLV